MEEKTANIEFEKLSKVADILGNSKCIGVAKLSIEDEDEDEPTKD